MKIQFGQEVLSLRLEKDSFFRIDMDSPIPSSDRSSFKGLNYFPPDEGYRVTSKLERFDSPKHIIMATSTGTRQTYLRYGAFTFEIKGQRAKLIVYKSAEDRYARGLFLPFSDETSGNETYAAGRYLDLEEQGGDDYELDFNTAYNPYCAYSEDYTCPIPPVENRLSVKILAGEKNYK
jgi:uncharacterized protein (DUF1684 family)